jgi:peptide/nickel transport system substrate-binding protein
MSHFEERNSGRFLTRVGFGLSRRSLLLQAGALGLASGLPTIAWSTAALADVPGLLRVDIGGEPGTLDPLTVSDAVLTTFLQETVVEALTAVGSAEGGVTPVLAESWEAKGTNWVFHLRKGIRFHTGSEMTSADVVASYKRALDPGSQIGASRLNPGMEIAALDDYTVEWRLSNVDPTVPARAAAIFIVPADYAALSDQRLQVELPGTGPYRLTAWNKGINITLAAFKDYWSGNPPPIPQVELLFNQEAAVRFAGIQSGEIQAAMRMPIELANDQFKVIAVQFPEVLLLRLNNLKGPFSDQRLREAANLAVDRQLLIDQLYGGYAKLANAQICTDAVFGYSRKVTDFPYDPDKAKKLLQEANAVGVKIRMNATRGQYTNDAEAAEAIAGMLNAVGFDVDLNIPIYSEFRAAHFAPKADNAPDISMAVTSNEMFDLTRQYQWLHCDGKVSSACIPEADSLMDKAATITDPAQRQALYDQMWEIFKREATYAFILSPEQIAFVDKRVQWTPHQNGMVRFQDWSFSA